MRMKPLTFLFTVLSGPLFGGDGSAPQVPVAVYVEFEYAPALDTRLTMQNEVRGILAPLGFDAQWRNTSEAGLESWPDLAVVSFKGHCDVERTSFPDFVPGALGWTRVTDGKIQPFAVVDCDRIGAMVHRPLSA